MRKLEALEEDRYDQLPDAVFVRALASSVCRTLKIDPQPVLRAPAADRPRRAWCSDSEGINAPFRAPGDGAAADMGRPAVAAGVLAVFALLLGALVLVLLPTAQPAMTPAAGRDTGRAGRAERRCRRRAATRAAPRPPAAGGSAVAGRRRLRGSPAAVAAAGGAPAAGRSRRRRAAGRAPQPPAAAPPRRASGIVVFRATGTVLDRSDRCQGRHRRCAS